MTIGEQSKDEKRRIKDEKCRQDEKLRIKDEKCTKDEKLRIEDEKRRKDEKRRIDEKRSAEMKELIKTAKIYYSSCSPAVKDAAKKFFEDIDQDKDGKVRIHEFLEFMKQEGHKKMSSREFFNTLDMKGSGTLGFMEVLAIFYIIQSGRPFCHSCNVFVAGMYFTCSKCHESDNKNVIFLCPDCFENGSHTDPHGRNQFLDNYALLALKRKQRIARAGTHPKQVQRTPSKDVASTSNKNNALVRYPTPRVVASTSNTNNAIVRCPATHQHKWKPMFEKFLLALQAAGFIAHSIANGCTCTIM